MNEARKGRKVKVHYKGMFEDGTLFDSSEGREPLEFVLGGGQMIEGFDEAVPGMKPGEKKTVRIPSEKAYGPRHEELVLLKKKNEFPPAIKPEIGLRLQVRHPSGGTLGVTVTGIKDETVTLDGNHPLAGRDLVFEIELVEVEG